MTHYLFDQRYDITFRKFYVVRTLDNLKALTPHKRFHDAVSDYALFEAAQEEKST